MCHFCGNVDTFALSVLYIYPYNLCISVLFICDMLILNISSGHTCLYSYEWYIQKTVWQYPLSVCFDNDQMQSKFHLVNLICRCGIKIVVANWAYIFTMHFTIPVIQFCRLQLSVCVCVIIWVQFVFIRSVCTRKTLDWLQYTVWTLHAAV